MLKRGFKMKLGMLINTDKYLDAVLGITDAALSMGHEVIIFIMDEGTRLLENPLLTTLCTRQGVKMSLCEHSAQRLGVKVDGLPNEIVCGSQYRNAIMMHTADKVIIL